MPFPAGPGCAQAVVAMEVGVAQAPVCSPAASPGDGRLGVPVEHGPPSTTG